MFGCVSHRGGYAPAGSPVRFVERKEIGPLDAPEGKQPHLPGGCEKCQRRADADVVMWVLGLAELLLALMMVREGADTTLAVTRAVLSALRLVASLIVASHWPRR